MRPIVDRLASHHGAIAGTLCLTGLLLAGTGVALAQSPPVPHHAAPHRSPRTATAPVPPALNVEQRAQHVLDRLAYGPTPGAVTAVVTTGVDRWVEQQLHPEAWPDSVERLLPRFRTIALPPESTVVMVARPDMLKKQLKAWGLARRADSLAVDSAQRASNNLLTDLQAARVARAVASEHQLQEVLVDFWANHFSVFAGKAPVMRAFIPAYERDVIRPRVFGRFRDLLGAVAHSPAMLYYLDNWQSAADPSRRTLAELTACAKKSVIGSCVPPRPRTRGLNENYGRELLELHTLGVDGGYTQADVIAAAQAFTGWTLQDPNRDGRYLFRPEFHDAGPKQFLGTTLPGGRGEEDGEEVLDLVARHPATARFIATKLIRRFVGDSAPPALVERVAAVFTKTDGDLRETVRAVVTSPEFWSREAFRSKVKSPLELVASSMRAVGAAADTSYRTAGLVAQLGQPLYGHPAPDGYPEVSREWLGTGAILARVNYGLALANGQVPSVSLSAWVAALGNAGTTRAAQAERVATAILGGPPSAQTRELLAGEVDDVSQQPAGRAATRDTITPAVMRPAAPPVDLAGLVRMAGLTIGAPEFQYR